jgi:hypothetical protein
VVSSAAVLQMPCTKVASSLGILLQTHVFITACSYGCNLPQKLAFVNPWGGKTVTITQFVFERMFGYIIRQFM